MLVAMAALAQLATAAAAGAGGGVPSWEATSGPGTISMHKETAEYALRVGSRPWLESAPTMLRSEGGWLELSVLNTSSAQGSDAALGRYTRLAALLARPAARPRLGLYGAHS